MKNIMDKNISKVSVNYIDFNGDEKIGVIEVHKLLSSEVKTIFNEIKDSEFQIEKIEPISNYNYSDEQSVRANNTSSYNFRFVGETNKLSDHTIGFAIDINPLQNPWVHPTALNISTYNERLKGTILRDSEVVKIFENYGWTWGGNWKNPDYQHFFKGGDLNKQIKNNLYDLMGIENPYLKKESRIYNFNQFVNESIKIN